MSPMQVIKGLLQDSSGKTLSHRPPRVQFFVWILTNNRAHSKDAGQDGLETADHIWRALGAGFSACRNASFTCKKEKWWTENANFQLVTW
jgi:hypothetical protein